jgi:hypothetical protein
MSRATVLASVLLVVVSVVACSSSSSDSTTSPEGGAATSKTCVDFVVTDEEKTCTLAADCTFVAALRVCPGDDSCGGQIPMNRAGAARYDRETSAIPRTQGSCGKAAPQACVSGLCVVCSNASACPDGG